MGTGKLFRAKLHAKFGILGLHLPGQLVILPAHN